MTKKEIIDYIMETPQNTNTAILSQMLDEFAGEGGGSMEPLIVNAINVRSTIYEMDKTVGELNEAFSKGIPITMYFQNGLHGYVYGNIVSLEFYGVEEEENYSAHVYFQNGGYVENWGVSGDSLEELMSAHPSYSYD